MGNENKLGSVFSWADEVEKEEEEEEARTQVHEKQKPNPFGSARPREVVLQEKGIDWRKLDQDLQPPSRTRYEPPKEKPRKENIPAPAAILDVNKKPQFHPSGKGQERKLENIKIGSIRREVPQVLSTPQNHIPEVFGPPLRYPPKNVVNLLKVTRGSYHPYMSDYIEPEREKANHELRPKQFHNSESLGRSSHNFNIEWENQHAVFDYSRTNFNVEELRRDQSMEALHNGRKPGKSAAREKRRIADSNYKRTKFFEQNLVGSPSVNERRGAILMRDDIRWHSGMLRYGTEEISWEKMEYDREEQNIARKFEVSSREAAVSDGGRAKGNHKLKMKKSGDFGGNYRKRGMKLESANNRHCH